MILTFSRTSFKDAIIAGSKTTTIRADQSNRWKEGRVIQFWLGSPRNKQSLALGKHYQFGSGICTKVEKVFINSSENYITITTYNTTKKITQKRQLDYIAKRDGFKSWQDMKLWFPTPFFGNLIHFKLDISKIYF